MRRRCQLESARSRVSWTRSSARSQSPRSKARAKRRDARQAHDLIPDKLQAQSRLPLACMRNGPCWASLQQFGADRA